MKIVYLITALGYGGAEILLSKVCNHLVNEHDVTVVHYKPLADVKPMFDPRVQILHIPLSLKAPLATHKLLKHLCPDVVHTHLGHADLIGFLATLGIKCKKYVHLHNIWFKFNWLDNIFFAIYRIFLTHIQPAYEVISISRSVYAHAAKRLGVPAERNHLVYNAIDDIDYDDLRVRYPRTTAEPKQILFVGRLEKQKAVDILIKALGELPADVPAWHLHLLGEGSLRPSLEAQARQQLPPGSFTFHGNVADPLPYYMQAHFLVVPSIFEGFSIVTIEAFRAGLPVIASNLEGPAELIKHGHNGLLFQPGNVAACSEAIQQLLLDEPLRSRLGTQARAAFEGRFKSEFYFTTLLKLYQRAS